MAFKQIFNVLSEDEEEEMTSFNKAIHLLRNADGGVGGGGCQIFQKKRYEGVMFNVIMRYKGWVGVQFAENSVT